MNEMKEAKVYFCPLKKTCEAMQKCQYQSALEAAQNLLQTSPLPSKLTRSAEATPTPIEIVRNNPDYKECPNHPEFGETKKTPPSHPIHPWLKP